MYNAVYSPVVTICTASLTFSNSTFCPHTVFMCFVWISEQTAIISLYSINWLVCITATECVYCAVRKETLYIIQLNARLMLFHNFLTMDEVLQQASFTVVTETFSCTSGKAMKGQTKYPVFESRSEQKTFRTSSGVQQTATWRWTSRAIVTGGSAEVTRSGTYRHMEHGQEVFKGHFMYYFFLHGSTAPNGPGPPHCRGFTITLRHTTVGRTPLDEWSARRRELYLKTHDTHTRQTSIPPAGFEPAISAGERPQVHALNRTATGNGTTSYTRPG
jgi:hypothetical protein